MILNAPLSSLLLMARGVSTDMVVLLVSVLPAIVVKSPPDTVEMPLVSPDTLLFSIVLCGPLTFTPRWFPVETGDLSGLGQPGSWNGATPCRDRPLTTT